MFLHLSVTLFIEGMSDPLDAWIHPPTQADTPRQIPPLDTTGYSLQAGGTHPTGMQSCFTHSFRIKNKDKCLNK